MINSCVTNNIPGVPAEMHRLPLRFHSCLMHQLLGYILRRRAYPRSTIRRPTARSAWLGQAAAIQWLLDWQSNFLQMHPCRRVQPRPAGLILGANEEKMEPSLIKAERASRTMVDWSELNARNWNYLSASRSLK